MTDAATHREIERTQRIVEGEHYSIRMTLLKYSHLVELQRIRFQDVREGLLAGGAATTWLEERDPALLSRLAERDGATSLDRTLQRILLSRLDDAWADYLVHVAEVREGIYLYSVGGSSMMSFKIGPIDAFRAMLQCAFLDLEPRVEKIVLDVLRQAVERRDVSLEKVSVKRPSATWTYIVNDDPFADLGRNVVSKIRDKLKGARQTTTSAQSRGGSS